MLFYNILSSNPSCIKMSCTGVLLLHVCFWQSDSWEVFECIIPGQLLHERAGIPQRSVDTPALTAGSHPNMLNTPQHSHTCWGGGFQVKELPRSLKSLSHVIPRWTSFLIIVFLFFFFFLLSPTRYGVWSPARRSKKQAFHPYCHHYIER